MSHSVNVTLIADQFIEVAGEEVNVHSLETIRVDGHGQIVSFVERDKNVLVALASDKATLDARVGEPTWDEIVEAFYKDRDDKVRRGVVSGFGSRETLVVDIFVEFLEREYVVPHKKRDVVDVEIIVK